ncbi:MAG: 1-(5-phosphoribosyl)-5-[(5-phosphoribosylamino)methylideneamino]imidazole-4-carboxamide isomerase [Aquificaceae bacterium]
MEDIRSFIIPAIDRKGGKVVRLFKGEFEHLKDYGKLPEDMARFYNDVGFRRVHVVDLDGTLEGIPKNLESIRKIRKAFYGKVQMGGGIRALETCRLLYDEGIDFFVVGTLAVKEPKTFELMVESFPFRVILSVDSRHGKVAISGWKEESKAGPEDLAMEWDKEPIWGYLYTDIKRDGTLEGVNVNVYKRFRKHTQKPIIASGGVASLEDVKKLFGVVEGVIVGKAIYEGLIDIKSLEIK